MLIPKKSKYHKTTDFRQVRAVATYFRKIRQTLSIVIMADFEDYVSTNMQQAIQ